MNRRQAVVAVLAVGTMPNVRAQQARRVYRVGWPAFAPRAMASHLFDAFEQGLREHGYSPGRDVLIDYRTADGKIERFPGVVQDIVSAKPDVIITGVNSQTNTVRAATRTIPIVIAVGQDVVRAGYAESLAKPGGNITGMTEDAGGATVVKRLELQRTLVPTISRVGVLWEAPTRTAYASALEGAASRLGLSLFWHEYTGDLERHFAEMLQSIAFPAPTVSQSLSKPGA